MDKQPIARIQTQTSVSELFVKNDHGAFATKEEAEKEALKLARAPDADAIVIKDDETHFHVYTIDEVHPHMPVGGAAGKLISEAPIVSFVITEPLTGKENILGQRTAQEIKPPKTSIEGYVEKFNPQISKILGTEKDSFIDLLKNYELNLKSEGISINIELSDDVFENKDKLLGFKNFLQYTNEHVDTLKERSINNVSIVDEADNWWGVKVDLDYDKKAGKRTLTLGDDYLDDWGESLNLLDKSSLKKLDNTLGKKLTDAEMTGRSTIYRDMNDKFKNTYQQLNLLQQNLETATPEEFKKIVDSLKTEIEKIEKDSIPEARTKFKKLSVSDESEISLDYLEKFENTNKDIKENLGKLQDGNHNTDLLQTRALIEKTKILLIKGVSESPAPVNHFTTYVNSSLNNPIPGAGMMYSHSFGEDESTMASIKLGYTPFKNGDATTSNMMVGVDVGHKFYSDNKLLNGTNAGVGVGIGITAPLFAGVNVNNSWYLNDYHGQGDELSVVGGAYASVGTYNNIGAYVDFNKQLSSNVEIEGTGELSLFNQNVEIEGEFKLLKNKDLYLTAGIGTNKLLYAGVGFAGKYELEAGLGGISFGKDSDNLPGESSWEIGIRTYLPIPYYKYHQVPGYQFTYADKSKEYITTNGTFMTIKEDEHKEEHRVSYVVDPKVETKDTEIAYRVVKSKEELDNMDKAPLRKINIESLGYLTVTEGGNLLIDNGRIVSPLTNADVGIITDQAGVLWFDKRKSAKEPSLSLRRNEIPLPLYRPVQQ
jgi:hypothetical protein